MSMPQGCVCSFRPETEVERRSRCKKDYPTATLQANEYSWPDGWTQRKFIIHNVKFESVGNI